MPADPLRLCGSDPLVCDPLAFTLVELLVVIAIIVILLALLVGGLERALKAAERAKCGANQKSLAQTAVIYSNQFSNTLPPRGSSPDSAMDLRDDTTNPTPVRGSTNAPNPTPPPWPDAISPAARGLGRMVVTGHLPNTKLGEMIHCPSLDTSSGVPAKFGMDEIYNDSPQAQKPSSQAFVDTTSFAPTVNDTVPCAGGSYWNDQAQANRRIVASYNYRAMSYAATKGVNILTHKVGSGFALTCDLVTNQTAASSGMSLRKYGRPYHHKTGWNVSFADGHVSYVANEPLSTGAGKDTSYVEQKILGDGTNSNIEMNGWTKPNKDEEVYDYFKTK